MNALSNQLGAASRRAVRNFSGERILTPSGVQSLEERFSGESWHRFRVGLLAVHEKWGEMHDRKLILLCHALRHRWAQASAKPLLALCMGMVYIHTYTHTHTLMQPFFCAPDLNHTTTCCT